MINYDSMEIKDLVQALKDVFDGEPWFGTSVMDSLASIPTVLWDRKSSPSRNTIAALVWHMIDWRYFVIEKLNGNTDFDITLNTTADWREEVAVKNEEDVVALIKELKDTQRILCELLMQKEEVWLFKKTAGKSYNNVYMVQGLIQHDSYHLGQINLIHSQLK